MDQRTAVYWSHQIRDLVDVHYPYADLVILVMYNLNTHTGASLYKALEPKEVRRILEKLEIYYTPKHGSWLNVAGIELSILSRQCMDRRIPDQETIKKFQRGKKKEMILLVLWSGDLLPIMCG